MISASDAQPDAPLDPTSLVLTIDSLGRLCAVDATGARFEGIVPLRLFPLSDPEHWIALVDSEQRELCVVADIAALAADTAECLRQELTRREFVPVLIRINWVSGNTEPCEFKVDTDRGQAEFILQSEDDIRRLGKHSVLVLDAHGIRYLIPDDRKLDAYSKRVIDWYV
jgi:hypothetical protein